MLGGCDILLSPRGWRMEKNTQTQDGGGEYWGGGKGGFAAWSLQYSLTHKDSQPPGLSALLLCPEERIRLRIRSWLSRSLGP